MEGPKSKSKGGVRPTFLLLQGKFGVFGGQLLTGQHLGFAPIGVSSRDHYVEDPLMAFFFRLDQALSFQGTM